MGCEKFSFKRSDDEDSDCLEDELEGEGEIMAVFDGNTTREEEALPSGDSDDDDDDDDDSDSDFLVESEEDEASSVAVESDTDSIKSLRAGREPADEDEDDDDIIKIMKRAKNVKKLQPPTITCDDLVTSISFSPCSDIIAVGSIEGDVCLYHYDVEKTELALKYTPHKGSCRRIEYDDSGELIYTVSDDKSVKIANASTGKFKKYTDAHEHPIYSLTIVGGNLFATGDDEGYVKLWDKRKQGELFSMRVGEEYVSSLCSLEESSTLVCTVGDGTVCAINTNTRKMVKSDPYNAEITCSGLFCSNTKLAVGTSIGSLLMYSWGQFSTWNDEFPGIDKKKRMVNCMVPVTENITVTGLDNGMLRATNLFPMRHVGIVGQHGSTVECLDINRDGTLLASGSIDNTVCFWNIEYFEDIHITHKMKAENEKVKEHNLPSSHRVNATDFFSGLA